MRAMTFERLIRNERFVSQLLTTAVGRLGLARPTAVRRVDGHVSPAKTATAIGQAHLKAVHEDIATMITGMAVPFVGMEAQPGATPVKPDFCIVAPRHDDPKSEKRKVLGSWLIMGDAKDYERVRSRIIRAAALGPRDGLAPGARRGPASAPARVTGSIAATRRRPGPVEEVRNSRDGMAAAPRAEVRPRREPGRCTKRGG